MPAKACADCGALSPAEDYPVRSGKKNRERGTRDNVCPPCRKLRKRAEYASHGRAAQLRRNFNLSLEEYDAMLARQGGRCAICRAGNPRGGHGWSVDHDHRCCSVKGRSCGRCVRGLLCLPCNTVLGAMNDDADLLREAAKYLVQGGVSRMDPIAG